VPKKKTTPHNQPRKNDFTADFFSRSIAQNKGASATQARNQNSKSGKARASRIADKTAKSEFCGEGNFAFARVKKFMATV